MTTLPRGCLPVRTWFGSDIRWHSLLREVNTPSSEGFRAYVEPVDDPAFEGLTADELKEQHPGGAIVSFLADQVTLTNPDHPILAVWVLPRQADDTRPIPMPFRVVPTELWGVENNINIANMDWHDFTRSLGPDGVFRGFGY